MATQADRVYAAINATETTEAKVGTITSPTAGVRHIVGVYAVGMQPTGTNGELVSGYVRLSFKTISGVFKFPMTAYAGQGAVGIAATIEKKIIPVDIPFPANETCDIYMAWDVAGTGSGTGEAGLIME